MLESDERTVQRHARDERFCAVDWIENPSITRGTNQLAKRLADDSISRIPLGDWRSQELFRFTIGDGHGSVVRFHIDRELSLAKIPQRVLPCLTRDAN